VKPAVGGGVTVASLQPLGHFLRRVFMSKKPGGPPGAVEEAPTQSPPNKPGQYEDPKKTEERDGMQLPPEESPVKQDEPPPPVGDQGHVS
jgi:hypothetical protein